MQDRSIEELRAQTAHDEARAAYLHLEAARLDLEAAKLRLEREQMVTHLTVDAGPELPKLLIECTNGSPTTVITSARTGARAD